MDSVTPVPMGGALLIGVISFSPFFPILMYVGKLEIRACLKDALSEGESHGASICMFGMALSMAKSSKE